MQKSPTSEEMEDMIEAHTALLFWRHGSISTGFLDDVALKLLRKAQAREWESMKKP